MKLTTKSVLFSQYIKMPIIGFGTWQATEEEITLALSNALEIGYRHIDTAYVYSNEAAIGKELEKWFSNNNIKREDLFIVTKLPNIGNRANDVERFIKTSLQALKLEYVDLYLVHNPVGLKCSKDDNIFPIKENGEVDIDVETDLISLWKAMEEMVDKGYSKAIGLSNFNIKQIDRILKSCHIPPANLQVEMHVYLQQKDLLDFCKKNNITVVAYAPLGSPGLVQFSEKIDACEKNFPKLSLMNDPVVTEIAKRYGKTTAQVLLRFLLQVGVAVIPKSINSFRIKQNFEVFDFELDEEDMKKMKALDKGKDGRMFAEVFKGMNKHPEYPY